MADSGAERKVREMLDGAKFRHENTDYEIIQNEKPYPETKTDFYIVARNLGNDIEKEFKISYKKNTYSFVENKVKPDRIKEIYGKDWSEILKNQIQQKNNVKQNTYWKKSRPEESLVNSFKNHPLINFKRKKIMLGWRYEIEQLDAAGNRLHSGKIDQDISPQIFWGKNCHVDMRDAKIGNKNKKNSGIPDFILIRSPEQIKKAQDIFDNMTDIQDYAKKHREMRVSFISQYYRESGSGWKTEGLSRSFAVWIKWTVSNGRLRGNAVFDKPLEKESGEVLGNLRNCLEEMGEKMDDNFNIEALRGRLTPDTISV